MKARLTLLALPFLLLASCGGSNPKALTDEGSSALGSGQYEVAAKKFEGALAAMGSDSSSPDWLRAKIGLCQAHARTDGGKAKDEFLELAKAHPDKVTDKHFSLMGRELDEARHSADAIAVLTAGMTAHPTSAELQGLRTALGKKAEQSGDSETLESLKGLGYVGGK